MKSIYLKDFVQWSSHITNYTHTHPHRERDNSFSILSSFQLQWPLQKSLYFTFLKSEITILGIESSPTRWELGRIPTKQLKFPLYFT